MVFIASDGRALDLLKREFPGLPFFELPDYGVKYRSKNMVVNMLAAAPRLLAAVFNEYFLVKTVESSLILLFLPIGRSHHPAISPYRNLLRAWPKSW